MKGAFSDESCCGVIDGRLVFSRKIKNFLLKGLVSADVFFNVVEIFIICTKCISFGVGFE